MSLATLWPQPNCPGRCQTWLSQLGPRSPSTPPPRPPPRRSKCLYWLYLSHFLMDWAEILHDWYLGGKDEVCRQNIDPAALQYSMQRCRISNRTITQPFLIGLSWNFLWLFLRWKQSSLDTKQWRCSTAVFHAAHAEFQPRTQPFSMDWAEILHDDSLSGKDQV